MFDPLCEHDDLIQGAAVELKKAFNLIRTEFPASNAQEVDAYVKASFAKANANPASFFRAENVAANYRARK